MSTGLIALLDDIVALAKLAAVTLDDVGLQAAKAGAKSAGVVVDDAAVTPKYVVGFSADRELPIVYKIAVGSVRNKLLYLLPAAIGLSAFAPWAITPLLMLGGTFLCYEGAEKIIEALFGHSEDPVPPPVAELEAPPAGDDAAEDLRKLEAEKVAGAIRTDFILSAEIMAIALSTLTTDSYVMQAVVLAAVGIGITVAVYGAVAIIVKADDMGIALAQVSPEKRSAAPVRAFGRGIVSFMPYFLKMLTVVGTAAMLWVGGGIIMHGIAGYGFHGVEHLVHDIAGATAVFVQAAQQAVTWFMGALGAAVFGMAIGAVVWALLHFIVQPVWTKARA